MSIKSKHPKTVKTYFGTDATLRSLLAEHDRLNDLLDLVRSCLPEPLNEHCIAVVNGKNGLILYTESSAWASRLRFFSRQLAKKLQANEGFQGKISVRVLITRHARKVNSAGTRLLTPENADLIEQLAESIDDHDLSRALKRLSHHSTK